MLYSSPRAKGTGATETPSANIETLAKRHDSKSTLPVKQVVTGNSRTETDSPISLSSTASSPPRALVLRAVEMPSKEQAPVMEFGQDGEAKDRLLKAQNVQTTANSSYEVEPVKGSMEWLSREVGLLIDKAFSFLELQYPEALPWIQVLASSDLKASISDSVIEGFSAYVAQPSKLCPPQTMVGRLVAQTLMPLCSDAEDLYKKVQALDIPKEHLSCVHRLIAEALKQGIFDFDKIDSGVLLSLKPAAGLMALKNHPADLVVVYYNAVFCVLMELFDPQISSEFEKFDSVWEFAFGGFGQMALHRLSTSSPEDMEETIESICADLKGKVDFAIAVKTYLATTEAPERTVLSAPQGVEELFAQKFVQLQEIIRDVNSLCVNKCLLGKEKEASSPRRHGINNVNSAISALRDAAVLQRKWDGLMLMFGMSRPFKRDAQARWAEVNERMQQLNLEITQSLQRVRIEAYIATELVEYPQHSQTDILDRRNCVAMPGIPEDILVKIDALVDLENRWAALGRNPNGEKEKTPDIDHRRQDVDRLAQKAQVLRDYFSGLLCSIEEARQSGRLPSITTPGTVPALERLLSRVANYS